MTRKRRILQLLHRDELIAAVHRFELEVGDRRVRAQLIDALAGSRKAALSDVLVPLSRDRLKELCRALDLDDRGRAKDAFVARGPSARPQVPTSEASAGAAAHRPATSRSTPVLGEGASQFALPVAGVAPASGATPRRLLTRALAIGKVRLGPGHPIHAWCGAA